MGGGRVGGGVRVDVNEELKFSRKFAKKKSRGGGGGGSGCSGWGAGQGGCERRIEVFVKIKKYLFFCLFVFFLGGSGSGRGSGWGFRVDVNEELNFLRKFAKKWGVVGGFSGWGWPDCGRGGSGWI